MNLSVPTPQSGTGWRMDVSVCPYIKAAYPNAQPPSLLVRRASPIARRTSFAR
jgi:hypothetical protein